jgi:hypothetical protein
MLPEAIWVRAMDDTTADTIMDAVAADAAVGMILAVPAETATTVVQPQAACANCGAALSGPFCAECGQSSHELRRPLWSLVEQLLESVFHFDGRGLRTYYTLLARPGRLTADYLAGRRARYVPPVRLYIFTSVVFFLALSLTGLVFLQVASLDKTMLNGQPVPTLYLKLFDRPVTFSFDPKELEDPDGPLKIRIEASSGDQTVSAEEIIALVSDPVRLSELEAKWLPKVLVVTMPVLALLLGLLYIRQRRFLIEHLVLSLHLHVVLFAVGTVMVLLRVATGHVVPAPLLGLLLLAYFVLTIRTVYRQDWVRTLLKSAALTVAYPLILVSATAAVALYAAGLIRL